MLDWIFSVSLGLLLGYALFRLVRMRGRLIPISNDQIAGSGRVIWALTMVLMVLLSNIGLIALRKGLLLLEVSNTLYYEAVFAAVSFALAMYLVTRRGCGTDCSVAADSVAADK